MRKVGPADAVDVERWRKPPREPLALAHLLIETSSLSCDEGSDELAARDWFSQWTALRLSETTLRVGALLDDRQIETALSEYYGMEPAAIFKMLLDEVLNEKCTACGCRHDSCGDPDYCCAGCNKLPRRREAGARR